jgi:hypothetical protein
VRRVALAVKSAAMPDVLSGRDLLQGNGLSQAGGALFQVVGIGFALGAAAALPAWLVVVLGAGLLAAAAIVATRMRHAEVAEHERASAGRRRACCTTSGPGIRELAARPPAAWASLVPDASLPVLGVRAVHVRAVREEPRRGR